MPPPARSSAQTHGDTIRGKVDTAVAAEAALTQIQGIDPELILKISLAAAVQEDAWRLAGFKVLAQEPNNILVVFTDDTELKEFRSRLSEYQKGPTGTKKLRPIMVFSQASKMSAVSLRPTASGRGCAPKALLRHKQSTAA